MGSGEDQSGGDEISSAGVFQLHALGDVEGGVPGELTLLGGHSIHHQGVEGGRQNAALLFGCEGILR